MPSTTGKSMIARCLLAFLWSFCLTATFALWTTPLDAATDAGFRFASANAKVTNNTTNYSTNVAKAASAWNQYSDLVITQGAGGNINFWEGNYGANGWNAGTEPYNQNNQACVNWPSLAVNSNCNTTNKKATYGYIYMNTYYAPFPVSANYLTRHEMGHMFGLGHVDCSVDSLMKIPACGNLPTTLRADEINQINAWY